MLLLRKLNYFITMTNFNGINPWLNMLYNLNSANKNQVNSTNLQAQNAQNSAPVQNIPASNSPLIQNSSANNFEQIPTNYLVNSAEQNALQDVIKMNNEVVQKYLQSLLDMPESLDKLLKSLNSDVSEKNMYQFLKLFVEGMLNNKELSQLLNQNSNDAIQKLLNVITQSLKSGADTSQLKEILSVLNVIHTSSSINSNTLRELFLLYIPLNYQIYKDEGNFGGISSEDEESIKENALSILFETCNFSNIMASLNEFNNTVTIEIHANKDFPYDKFKKMIEIIAKENSINIACDILKTKEYETKCEKQNFKILSDDFVSIKVLNVSYIVVKTIFKLDGDLSNSINA